MKLTCLVTKLTEQLRNIVANLAFIKAPADIPRLLRIIYLTDQLSSGISSTRLTASNQDHARRRVH